MLTENIHKIFNFTPLIAYTNSDWTGIHFRMNKRRGIIRNLPVKDHIPSQETLGLPILVLVIVYQAYNTIKKQKNSPRISFSFISAYTAGNYLVSDF